MKGDKIRRYQCRRPVSILYTRTVNKRIAPIPNNEIKSGPQTHVIRCCNKFNHASHMEKEKKEKESLTSTERMLEITAFLPSHTRVCVCE